MIGHPGLGTMAERHGVSPAQVALAWTLRQDGVNAIPRAGTAEHAEENRASLDLQLTPGDLAELDRMFPPPTGPRPLEAL